VEVTSVTARRVTGEPLALAAMQSDLDFLGMASGPVADSFTFTVEGHLARMDAMLYGGAAIAASMAAAEAVTGRSVVWSTTQFVATAGPGAQVVVAVEVLAQGRRASQVRVTGTDETGSVMFASLGATGAPDPDQPSGTFVSAPVVTDFERSPVWGGPIATMARLLPQEVVLPAAPSGVGFTSVLELAEPEVLEHPDPGPGRMAFWVRRRDGGPMTPAVVAYVADLVPMAVSSALGVIEIGTSLDNTIRVDPSVETDRVLLDLRPHSSIGGCCDGVVHAWAADGRLLATASQTALLRPIDPAMFAAPAE